MRIIMTSNLIIVIFRSVGSTKQVASYRDSKISWNVWSTTPTELHEQFYMYHSTALLEKLTILILVISSQSNVSSGRVSGSGDVSTMAGPVCMNKRACDNNDMLVSMQTCWSSIISSSSNLTPCSAAAEWSLSHLQQTHIASTSSYLQLASSF